MKLDCETEERCNIPKATPEMEKALAIRQDLHRLTVMGWPDKFKEEYVRQEYAPDLHLMHLSMLADQYVEDIEKKRVKD